MAVRRFRRSAFTCNSLRYRDFFAASLHASVPGLARPQAFTAEFCRLTGADPESVFLTGAGRMGLYLILLAMKLRPGDEVALPGLTCVVVPNALNYLGLKPLYLDVDRRTANLDTEAALGRLSARTRAIVVPHNFGMPYSDIARLREAFPELCIIEDVAHAMPGNIASENRLGFLGDAAFFSFEYSKPMTTGMGGLLVVNHPELARAVRAEYRSVPEPPISLSATRYLSTLAHLATSGRNLAFLKDWATQAAKKFRTGNFYRGEIAGEFPANYPVRMATWQAELGRRQLRRVDRMVDEKLRQAKCYAEILGGIPHLHFHFDGISVPLRFAFHVEDAVPIASVRKLRLRLERESPIAVGEWFSDPIHPKGSFRYGYVKGACPNAEWMAERFFNFPISIHARHTRRELEQVRGIVADEIL